ncbi:PilZ domain-containing protein [Microvirga sp. 2TAF3]|uniref:PilZ domain-containing protein n=1 Tax=Microvirga sp. 2TAF3 TaxID=3233014 RepID=UPI003F9C944B
MSPVEPRLPCSVRDNTRSARRLRVLQQAKIVFDTETMIHCVVRDLSTGGAKIEIRQHVPLPETFDLFICAHDLRVHRAQLRWRKGEFAGVSFDSDDVEKPVDMGALPNHAPARPYPVLIRSNPMIARPPEPYHPSYQSPVEYPAFIAVGEQTRPADGKSTGRSIQSGRYGCDRRRRKIR